MTRLTGAPDGAYEIVPIAPAEQSAEVGNTSTGYKSLFSDFLVRFCVAVALSIVLLLSGELFSYWWSPTSASDAMEPVINRKLSNASEAEREYWRQYDESRKFTFHPYVLWRRQPFHGSMINVDEAGIRRTSHSECNDRNFTVWMFGDSTLWGAGASDDETIPSLLAADYERRGQQVCVVNYGEGGWANTQEVIELAEQLKHSAGKPNIVIFYDGGTEAFTAYQSGQVDVPSNSNNFKNYLETWSSEQKPGFLYFRKTNTYRLLERVAEKLSGKRTEASLTDDQVESLAAGVLRNYEQNIDLVRLLARQFNFRPIFTWYPVLVSGHKPLTTFEIEASLNQEKTFPGITRMYRAAYRECGQAQAQYANLYCLNDVFDGHKEWLFRGISHVKPAGNQIVADRLYDIIEHGSSPATHASRSKAGAEERKRSNPA